MFNSLPQRSRTAVATSVATSCLLALIALILPNKAASPLVFVNWTLFGVATYFLFFPFPRFGSFAPSDMTRLKAWLLVFLSFTAASWLFLIRTDLIL